MHCRMFMLMKIESMINDHRPSKSGQILVLVTADVKVLFDFETLFEAICDSYLCKANIKLVNH